MSGPLDGLRVVELAGVGPGPHAAMILGDWGADVVRIVRRGSDGSPTDVAGDPQLRNRTVTAADLKQPGDVAAALDLISAADVLVEGLRPGVLERLGLGPDRCMARNPRLVYARMTGWGQYGPLAETAGHDINYLALTGMLAAIGDPHHPVVPLNLIADYGGGSMYLVGAILAAVLERDRSGLGQVLDVAMMDGVNVLAQNVWAFRNMGMWEECRCANMLDGGAPYYTVYACADEKFVAVGAVEQRFYDELLAGLGLGRSTLPDRDDQHCWPQLRRVLATAFAAKTRDDWALVFGGTDACVTPVLTMSEAVGHPQQQARRAFGTIGGILQTLPGPLFGRTSIGSPQAPGAQVRTLADVAETWRTPRIS